MTNATFTFASPLGSCQGPGGSAVPGTPVPYTGGSVSATCHIPTSSDQGTGVTWSDSTIGPNTVGTSGVCNGSGGFCEPAVSYGRQDLAARMTYQDGSGGSAYSLCLGICIGQGISGCPAVCLNQFSCGFGLTHTTELDCENRMVFVETYSCSGNLVYNAQEGCCCVDYINEGCDNGGTYDCNGNCVGGSSSSCSDNFNQPCGTCGNYECDGTTCDDSCSGGGGGFGWGDPCASANCEFGCADIYVYGRMMAVCEADADPIILDLDGSGYQLTSIDRGVSFDFYNDGKPVQVSWTAKGTNSGWLVLDRNGNGVIDNGWELFSSVTPQAGPAGSHLGFKALATYDTPRYGGNGDGWLDASDAIYSKLRVWVDRNHNGVSE